jgi:hypothetical protein
MRADVLPRTSWRCQLRRRGPTSDGARRRARADQERLFQLDRKLAAQLAAVIAGSASGGYGHAGVAAQYE